MSEAYMRKLAGDRFQVENAGFEPTTVNPLAVGVMNEEGIDISRQNTQSVFELYKQGRLCRCRRPLFILTFGWVLCHIRCDPIL